ncbi:SPOR domain-containing protein [Carboxylicivirga sp. A043]|uniref:SPOR domain-containing protein n=1 Tax=Carboxylicivirga litoralis TaxID=2816963 RepID=UPI0021CB8F92|nr:SPOR domain-containing protein [Carboxylicivirga sp. A043]MCU4157069.1 SPOR domain-containing protein [Carboxylicivirga sp. A043]
MYRLKSIALILLIIVTGLSELSFAQNKTYSAKEALVLFKEGNYAEAEKAYEYLLQRYDREIKYNYYYGICLIQNNNDIPQAVKRIKYAALKGVSRDAYYYLGRAYQLSYQFEEAIGQYNRFLKYASASDIRNEKAEKYKLESEMGLRQSAKVYNLEVYERDTVLKADFLSAYHPAADVGKVSLNSDFFESGVDPNGVLYLTERGDEVYFSKKDENSNGNLFKMEKLLDGWSESVALNGINSALDDCHPFVVIDGSTIYYSSNKEGGLGGYDLYKANYDAEQKTFINPVNLGIPFNSPKDDYLFVTDEFNELAWFASNRETNDSTLIVYTIKWNNSVVKNFVQDVNEVRQVASLPLSETAHLSTNKNKDKTKKETSKKDNQFLFVIADTLEYSHLDHFKSAEAKNKFKMAVELEARRDSLSSLMREKRKRYAQTNSDTERSMLVNDILSMEKKVYGLDEKIERTYYQSRVAEQDTIKELVAKGQYTSISQVRVERKVAKDLDKILIPDEYTFYTDEEFARQLKALEVMYQQLFDADQIQQLHHADSLYVWGNILNLESSKLLEEANNAPGETESVLTVIRSKDSVEEESVVQAQVFKAKELKLTALKLYHESLNKKILIYDERIKEILLSNTVDDLSQLEELQVQGKEYFKEAMDMIDPVNGFDEARYEKAGAIKRTGVGLHEQGLIQYAESRNVDGGEKPVKTTKVPKTYQELQGADVVKEEPAKVVEKAFKKPENQLVYKIQIGVFRNEPNDAAVAKIPPISKVEIPGKELTKYFAGNYASYAEAQNDVKRVHDAGFAGAFIVVFKDGKQINLTEELKK